jgi:hypothetical protein
LLEIDVPTNSVATARDDGSSKSRRMSLTNVECQSPVTTTGLLTSWRTHASVSR